ncbi:hypothetical protein [Rhizobium leguminosarum]|uniref:hypothetical protein n=1 Tax=Rhizobium leguminosarum TaxID=384 RepID=UPI003F9C84EC
MLRDKRGQVPATVQDIANWVDARFADDIVFLEEIEYDLEVAVPTLSQPGKARACVAVMDAAKIHPLAVEAELAELLEFLGSEPSKTRSAGQKAVQAWTLMKSRLSREV